MLTWLIIGVVSNWLFVGLDALYLTYQGRGKEVEIQWGDFLLLTFIPYLVAVGVTIGSIIRLINVYHGKNQ